MLLQEETDCNCSELADIKQQLYVHIFKPLFPSLAKGKA